MEEGAKIIPVDQQLSGFIGTLFHNSIESAMHALFFRSVEIISDCTSLANCVEVNNGTFLKLDEIFDVRERVLPGRSIHTGDDGVEVYSTATRQEYDTFHKFMEMWREFKISYPNRREGIEFCHLLFDWDGNILYCPRRAGMKIVSRVISTEKIKQKGAEECFREYKEAAEQTLCDLDHATEKAVMMWMRTKKKSMEEFFFWYDLIRSFVDKSPKGLAKHLQPFTYPRISSHRLEAKSSKNTRKMLERGVVA